MFSLSHSSAMTDDEENGTHQGILTRLAQAISQEVVELNSNPDNQTPKSVCSIIIFFKSSGATIY